VEVERRGKVSEKIIGNSKTLMEKDQKRLH
jgi:hypothetical protein